MKLLLLGAAGLGLMVSTSAGQVLLPPPEKPKGFDKVPPPPDPVNLRLRQALKDMTEDKMGDQDRRNANRDIEKAERQDAVNKLYTYESLLEELGSMPFESMIWRDENDQIVPLEQPPQIAAFNHNPLVDGLTLDSIFGVLADRRERIEQKLIEQPEIVKIIASGEIERASISDINGVQRMNMLMQRLNLPVHMLNELGTLGIIDQRQAFLNSLIEKEYNDAFREQIGLNHEEGMARAEALMVPMIRSRGAEPLFVYEEMLLDVSKQLGSVSQRLELRDDQSQSALDAMVALSSTDERSERIKIMNGFVSQLDVEQIQAFLRLAAG